MAAGPGFEPGQYDPESHVLPLHYPATLQCIKYNTIILLTRQGVII